MIGAAFSFVFKWILSRLFGGGGNAARDDAFERGKEEITDEVQKQTIQQLQAQMLAEQSRPVDDIGFASRLRDIEAHNGKPDTP